MALVQQQAIEFPFRTENGGAVIDAPRHLLAALRRSAVSTDQPKGLVLEELTRAMPSGWDEERESFASCRSV